MAELWKFRARKPVATGFPTASYYPDGISGPLLNRPCVCMHIEDYRLIIPVEQLVTWFEGIRICNESIATVLLKRFSPEVKS